MNECSELKSTLFFDSDGVLARTARLVLRAPAHGDLMSYVDAFGSSNPLIAKQYRINEKLQRLYWEGVMGEGSLYCSICARESGRFFGYCAVEDLGVRPFEIGVNLLAEYQAQGFGPEAVAAFMTAFRQVAGDVAFVARIEAENANSQKMFRRLGFAPAGIGTFIIKDPADLERFEQMRLDELGGIPEGLKGLADEFDVEPRKLLSHLLVFENRAG